MSPKKLFRKYFDQLHFTKKCEVTDVVVLIIVDHPKIFICNERYTEYTYTHIYILNIMNMYKYAAYTEYI